MPRKRMRGFDDLPPDKREFLTQTSYITVAEAAEHSLPTLRRLAKARRALDEQQQQSLDAGGK